MSQSREERSAYSRGYNTGRRDIDDVRRECSDKVERLAAGLNAVREGRFGSCSDCVHWTRGCEACAWGTCAASLGWPHPHMVSASGREPVSTSQNFACILWSPKP